MNFMEHRQRLLYFQKMALELQVILEELESEEQLSEVEELHQEYCLFLEALSNSLAMYHKETHEEVLGPVTLN